MTRAIQHALLSLPRALAGAVLLLGLTAAVSLSPAWAADTRATLETLETQFFAAPFPNDSVEARLVRIEEYVYGEAQTGSVEGRVEPLASLIVRSSAPATAQAPQTSPEQTIAQPATPQRRDATDYPAITAMEQRLFNRSFVQEDITNRLSRLEQKVFGRPTPQVALVDRVDRLDAKINAARVYTPPVLSPHQSAQSAISNLPASSNEFVGSPDTYTKLSALEKTVLNGQTNDGKLITERLDILEREVMGYTRAGESVDTRLNRLVRSYQSRAGTPYNKPYVPYSTYSQGYAPDTNSAAYPGGRYMNPGTVMNSTTTYANPYTGQQTTVREQNIQIGAGMSSISTYNFSPDLVQMLPPTARQQLRPVPGRTQTYSSRSSVSTGYNGGALSQAPPSMGGLYNPPAEVPENPALLAPLEDMEYRVFGGVYTMEKMPKRVERLEVALTGKPNPSLSLEARVSNLVKVVQYQSLANVLDTNRQQLRNMEGVQLRQQPPANLGIPLQN